MEKKPAKDTVSYARAVILELGKLMAVGSVSEFRSFDYAGSETSGTSSDTDFDFEPVDDQMWSPPNTP